MFFLKRKNFIKYKLKIGVSKNSSKKSVAAYNSDHFSQK